MGVVGVLVCRTVSPLHLHHVIPPPVHRFSFSPCLLPPRLSSSSSPSSSSSSSSSSSRPSPCSCSLSHPSSSSSSGLSFASFPLIAVSPHCHFPPSLHCFLPPAPRCRFAPLSSFFHPPAPPGCFCPFIVIAVLVLPSWRHPRSSSSTLLRFVNPSPPPPRPSFPCRLSSSSSMTLLLLIDLPHQLSSWVRLSSWV